MGIELPETCWACNKICNKYNLLHLVGILFPHNNDDARSKSLQSYQLVWKTLGLTQDLVSVEHVVELKVTGPCAQGPLQVLHFQKIFAFQFYQFQCSAAVDCHISCKAKGIRALKCAQTGHARCFQWHCYGSGLPRSHAVVPDVFRVKKAKKNKSMSLCLW